MLERFAGWLVGRMLASQAFPKEDAPLVSFGIVQGLRTLIEIILVYRSVYESVLAGSGDPFGVYASSYLCWRLPCQDADAVRG